MASDGNTRNLTLSGPQEAALAALLTGANLTEAATAASVVRQTVAVWLREDPAFLSEYQSRRAELWTGVRNRLEVRLVKAADTVAALLDHDDWRARLAASRVLLDLAARQFPSPPSPATPEEAADELRHRARAENRLSAQFRRVAKRAGFPGLSLHGLRHSCASRMVAKGVPLSFVAKVTGHSTLTCAARYGRHAPEDAARHAIRLLEGAEPGIVEAKHAPVAETPPTTPAEAPSRVASGA